MAPPYWSQVQIRRRGLIKMGGAVILQPGVAQKPNVGLAHFQTVATTTCGFCCRYVSASFAPPWTDQGFAYEGRKRFVIAQVPWQTGDLTRFRESIGATRGRLWLPFNGRAFPQRWYHPEPPEKRFRQARWFLRDRGDDLLPQKGLDLLGATR